jgi:hypothetical protein
MRLAPGARRRTEGDEGVARESRHRDPVGQSRGDAPGDRAKHLVAGLVTQRVVELLDAVQTQKQHGHRRLGRRSLELLLELVLEQRAVGKPGELVAQGLAADLVLDPLALVAPRQYVGQRLDEVDLLRLEAAGVIGVE